jgi:hypothetical protein
VFKEHVETLHGIIRLIIVRVAPFRRPLGTFHQQLSLIPRHRVGEAKNVVRLTPILLKAYFTPCEPFGSPLILLTVEGPTVPLSRGLFGFVALRCYAEECAFSLSTQAQDHVLDLVKYKRVEPAHCPTGATTGGIGCERFFLWAYRPPCLRTRLVLCTTGVLALKLVFNNEALFSFRFGI